MSLSDLERLPPEAKAALTERCANDASARRTRKERDRIAMSDTPPLLLETQAPTEGCTRSGCKNRCRRPKLTPVLFRTPDAGRRMPVSLHPRLQNEHRRHSVYRLCPLLDR